MSRAVFTHAGVLGILMSIICFAAYAADDKPRRFDIPSQELGAALKQFAVQSDLEILFAPKDAAAKRCIGFKGEFEREQALKMLLAGSGLTYRITAQGAIVVEPSQTSALVTDTGPMRLSQAESEQMQKVAAQNPENKQNSNAEVSSSEEADANNKGIPEILVKGRKTLNSDIRRTEGDAQPYVVFDAEELQKSQAVNLTEFLKTRLPMNGVQMSNNQTISLTSPFSSINLRGLGVTQTLILVDGRRMPAVSIQTSQQQPDVNTLPLSLIERIEVLPSTAGGIYGGGATGGVINIITRKGYSGIDLTASYGNTFDSDVSSRRLDASAGFNLEGGKTQVRLSATHSDANPLFVGERDFVRRGRALRDANNPVSTLATPPIGYTSNIRSQSGQNLVLDNNTPLGSPFTYIPVGYLGTSTDGGAALLANAGRYNLDLPADQNGTRQNLLAIPTVDSAAVNVRREFGARVEAFLDTSWSQNQGDNFIVVPFTTPTSVTLPATAPNNPFNAPIVVSFPYPGLSVPFNVQSKSLRAVGGLIVRLPRDWTAAGDYSWSRTRYSFISTDPVFLSTINGAYANSALDVMRDLNARPLDYTPYLLPSGNTVAGPADNILRDATVRLSGPLFTIPGGAVTLSSLIERREEKALDTFRDTITNTGVAGATFYPERTQTVDSYYLEARVPIFSEANAAPGMRTLELQVSARRDEYETTVPTPGSVAVASRTATLPATPYGSSQLESTNYTLGLRYSPFNDLMLRASYGNGFLPPAIFQLQTPISTQQPAAAGANLLDPKRGSVAGSVGSYTRIAGGNPDLTPESSDSWSAGVVFTPHIVPGLRLSVDYTRIEKTDEIRLLSAQQALDYEDLLPGHVTRNPDPATWGAFGVGPVTSIYDSFENVAGTTVEAYDLQIDYTVATARFGTYRWYALATRSTAFEVQVISAAPPTDSIGYDSGQLEWRGNIGVDWDRGPWTVGWNTQYYDSYRVYSAAFLAFPASLQSAVLNQGTDTIPSQIYHDLFVRYRFDDASARSSWLSNTEVSLGIQNVFNDYPPVLATSGTTGGYSFYGDPRLRRYSLSLRKHF